MGFSGVLRPLSDDQRPFTGDPCPLSGDLRPFTDDLRLFTGDPCPLSDDLRPLSHSPGRSADENKNEKVSNGDLPGPKGSVSRTNCPPDSYNPIRKD